MKAERASVVLALAMTVAAAVMPSCAVRPMAAIDSSAESHTSPSPFGTTYPSRASVADSIAIPAAAESLSAQPYFAPSHTMPVRQPAMFWIARSADARPPPRSMDAPAVIPIPAAIAHAQIAERRPMRLFMRIVRR